MFNNQSASIIIELIGKLNENSIRVSIEQSNILSDMIRDLFLVQNSSIHEYTIQIEKYIEECNKETLFAIERLTAANSILLSEIKEKIRAESLINKEIAHKLDQIICSQVSID